VDESTLLPNELPATQVALTMEDAGSVAPSPVHPSLGDSMTSTVVVQDSFMVASESVRGLQTGASGDESNCRDSALPTEDVHELRQMAALRQQRIDALENMHQQALRQLRKSREELARAQQQSFHEADRILRLKQLVSEMQAERFDGNMQAQMCWEEWLSRSRAIFEEEPGECIGDGTKAYM
jgi:hypothetical protein